MATMGNGPGKRSENELSGSGSGLPPGPGRAELEQKLAGKTTAQLMTKQEFLELKESQSLYVVGITGFSGQWSVEKVAADPVLREDVAAATVAVFELLRTLQQRHGDRLVISSGATMPGVPGIFYEACEHLGIAAMGVACEKAADYDLGTMRHLIIEGQDWGAESPTFLETSDEIVILGGGGQAKREAIAAGSQGKPVTIMQGYKGAADQLSREDVPQGEFVSRA